MIYIKNGHVTDPLTGTDEEMNVLIDGKLIKQVTKEDLSETLDKDTVVIDAAGMIVAPGLMDPHVHFRDPGFTYKEDIETGAKAAAKGGFTTVVCMANTKPVVDNPDTLHYIQEKGAGTDIHVLQVSTVTKGLQGKELVDMDLMADEGAAGFSDDGIPIMDEKLLYEAFQKAADLDMPVSLHEEDHLFVSSLGINAGAAAEKMGLGGADSASEEIMVARDSVIALKSGASVCIQHLSSKRSVEILRTFKKMGADLHAEATPHHFTLTENDVLTYGTYAKMNPPLRTEADREAIIEGLKDGTIDMIATDHAPHSTEEKEKPFNQAPSGIIGLETSLALGVSELVNKGHISMMKLIELMSTSPARFYRLKPGSIQEYEIADIVIFDPNKKWTVKDFASKASNSPFTGRELPAKVMYTICDGNIIYKA